MDMKLVHFTLQTQIKVKEELFYFAVRLDVWNRFCRCTSLMWLSRRRDVTRGRPERLWSLVLPDCLNRICVKQPLAVEWCS
jgi:hypothetical protein